MAGMSDGWRQKWAAYTCHDAPAIFSLKKQEGLFHSSFEHFAHVIEIRR